MDIVVQISTQTEWDALLALLDPAPSVEQTPLGACIRYTWMHGLTPVSGVLMHGGVGKIMAAASTQWAALVWQPRCLVLIGTCGAVDPAMRELDLVCATHTVVHDIAIEHIVRVLTTELEQHWQGLPTPHPVHEGMIVSGDMAITAHNVEGIRARHAALAADWESGAVAKICALNNVPCIVLKGISDTPDTTDVDDQFQRYRRNTPPVMERCWQVLDSWIAHGLLDEPPTP